MPSIDHLQILGQLKVQGILHLNTGIGGFWIIERPQPGTTLTGMTINTSPASTAGSPITVTWGDGDVSVTLQAQPVAHTYL
jgi:hypothetical protein